MNTKQTTLETVSMEEVDQLVRTAVIGLKPLADSLNRQNDTAIDNAVADHLNEVAL